MGAPWDSRILARWLKDEVVFVYDLLLTLLKVEGLKVKGQRLELSSHGLDSPV